MRQIMKKMGLMMGLMGLFGCSTSPPKTTTKIAKEASEKRDVQNFYEDVKKSIVDVETLDEMGDYTGHGSGFFLKGTSILVTNYHVVDNAKNVKIKTSEGAYYNVDKILFADSIVDLALLKVKMTKTPKGLDLAPPPKPGETVYVIGNPKGFEYSITEGKASPVRDDRGIKKLQFSAQISPGNSGGPVLNTQGQVVAVSTEYRLDGNDICFGPVSEEIQRLVDRVAIQKLKGLAFNDVDWGLSCHEDGETLVKLNVPEDANPLLMPEPGMPDNDQKIDDLKLPRSGYGCVKDCVDDPKGLAIQWCYFRNKEGKIGYVSLDYLLPLL